MKPTPSKKLLNGQYCHSCVMYCANLAINGIKFHLRGARSCVIPGCDNRTDQGDFVGDLCAPCHSYIADNEGTHSQAYRNEIFKASMRSIAKWLTDNPGGSRFIVVEPSGRKIEMMERPSSPRGASWPTLWRDESSSIASTMTTSRPSPSRPGRGVLLGEVHGASLGTCVRDRREDQHDGSVRELDEVASHTGHRLVGR
jgi:hypothetical protein